MDRLPSLAVTSYGYASIFNLATKEVVKLRFSLLRPYFKLPFGALPKSYELDLRSYCVLVSATLEQCIEDLAWAHYFEMQSEINTANGLGGYRLLTRAASMLQSGGESAINRSHGINVKHYKTLSKLVALTPLLSAAQKDSFKQLGILRGQSAHTYAVTQKDPKDIWAYTADVLRAARAFAVHCAGNATGLISV